MSDTEPDPQPHRPRRRGVLRWLLRGLALLAVLLAAGIILLAFPPNGRAVPLPDWARARIEAAMDASMPTGEVTLGGIGLSLSTGGLQPRIHFTDMQLSDAGRPRVAFPVLEVELDRDAALHGQLRPREVAVGGAGLRLRRDADGSLDLAFTGAETAEVRDLAQTMAGIDRMFQQTVFSRLDRVTGEDLTLIIDDARAGQTTRIDGASLALVPEGEDLTLSVGGRVDGTDDSRIDLVFTRRAALGETQFVARFDNLQSADIATASEALAWLTLVDAPLTGSLSTVLFDDATVGTLTGTLEVGEGRILPGGGVDPLPLHGLELTFDYDAVSARMRIERFSIDSPVLSAEVTGHATLLEGPVYVSQLQVRQIVADPPGLFEAPISFAGGAIDLRLQLFPFASIDLGQAVLFDEGLHLTARGRIAAEPDGLVVQMDAEIPQLDARRVTPLWPLSQIPNTRDWLIRNLVSGTVRNVHSGLRISPGGDPRFALTFDFEQAEVRALRGMAPIQQGRGYLDISDNVVSLALHEGFVTAPDGGQLDLSGSLMRIDDTRLRHSPASFDLRIGGRVSSVLTLIGAEPFNLLTQFPYDPGTVASGYADLDVSLAMEMRPHITPRDVTFQIDGSLRNVFSGQLVPGRDLRAARLTISADNDSLVIGGAARLDGLSANATWRRALGPDSTPSSTVEGTATLTPAALADFGVVLPDGMLRGQGEGQFTLRLDQGQPPRLTVTSDLSGLALGVPALGWSLPANRSGRLEADVILGDAPDVPRLILEGAGLSLDGAVRISEARQFDRLEMSRVQISDWLDVSGALVARGAGQTPLIQITGGRADLRGLPAGNAAGTGQQSLPLSIRLDRFDITDSLYLTDLRSELSGRPISGEFRGLVGGSAPVSGGILGEETGTAVRLRADDGGAVLRAAGIYRNAYGGAMELILRPRPGDGNYAGLLTIDNPRLINAPAFAELLSAISVVGLLDQMVSGEGIGLGDVRVQFTLSPGALSIQEATALGPSMGLSLDGVYDLRANHYDFEGVVSPLYLVNGLVGGLFTPRREGLFGFTYRLTGTPDDSAVSVNPLSVLTPGIFREIFRRPPPEPAQ